jgi:hypothetical protein
MNSVASGGGPPIRKLILVPALISLIVTLWRLTGELLSWSETFFNPEAGGMGAIIGITWLAPIFGVYFGLQLAKAGSTPVSWGRTVGYGLLGFIILFGGATFQPELVDKNFLGGLIYIWLVAVIAAGLQYPGWPALFKTLLAYALAARLPVILIMFLAMQGSWGTHYDAVPPGFPDMNWFAGFLWLAFFPQLIFWAGYTIVTGAFVGSVVASVVYRRREVVESAAS